MLYSFRCSVCGYLETSDNAGEAPHPHACRVCGSGVSFNPRTGAKRLEPDNWEILANCTNERLAKLGLKRELVKKHVPVVAVQTTNGPVNITRDVVDGFVAKDKL